MWIPYNPNPKGRNVGDCSIRAISKACGLAWQEAYLELALLGIEMGDMPSANAVWGAYLARNGFVKEHLANSCETEYTVDRFTRNNRCGTYVLALSSHVACAIDGDYFDSWDSGKEIVLYDWRLANAV